MLIKKNNRLIFCNKATILVFKILNEGVSDCCFIPNQQFFSYIMVRASYIQCIDDDSSFVIDQHAWLDFYSVRSLWRSSKYQSYSLWFDWGSNQRSTTLETITLNTTPSMQFDIMYMLCIIYIKFHHVTLLMLLMDGHDELEKLFHI